MYFNKTVKDVLEPYDMTSIIPGIAVQKKQNICSHGTFILGREDIFF